MNKPQRRRGIMRGHECRKRLAVCSSCKKTIEFGDTYWVCNVSTCNRKRMPMYFCAVSCWEAHLPTMRHREAYAVEKRAPSHSQWQTEARESQPSPRKVVAATSSAATPTASSNEDLPRDVLVVASKLKKYVRARSGMNTSDTVLGALSEHLRRICDQAIRTAAEDGRKTLLERDIPRPPPRS